MQPSQAKLRLVNITASSSTQASTHRQATGQRLRAMLSHISRRFVYPLRRQALTLILHLQSQRHRQTSKEAWRPQHRCRLPYIFMFPRQFTLLRTLILLTQDHQLISSGLSRIRLIQQPQVRQQQSKAMIQMVMCISHMQTLIRPKMFRSVQQH